MRRLGQGCLFRLFFGSFATQIGQHEIGDDVLVGIVHQHKRSTARHAAKMFDTRMQRKKPFKEEFIVLALLSLFDNLVEPTQPIYFAIADDRVEGGREFRFHNLAEIGFEFPRGRNQVPHVAHPGGVLNIAGVTQVEFGGCRRGFRVDRVIFRSSGFRDGDAITPCVRNDRVPHGLIHLGLERTAKLRNFTQLITDVLSHHMVETM